MSDKIFEFEEDSICDDCGAKGANDIYGDYICNKCMEKVYRAQEGGTDFEKVIDNVYQSGGWEVTNEDAVILCEAIRFLQKQIADMEKRGK